MTDDLHNGALVFEFLQFVLLDNLTLDLLDGDDRVLPSTSVDNTVSAFGQLTIVAQLIERDLVVLDERPSFVRDVSAASSILLVLDQGLFELALEVLGVGSSLLKLDKYLPLVWLEESKCRTFLLI